MYVTIDQTDYSELRSMSYSPQVDLVGDTVPINEFSVEIVTDDEIASGQYAELHDDMDNLWARYWIDNAVRVGDDAVRILARSEVALLDGVTLAPIMYSGTALSTVLDGVMVRQSGAGGVVAVIDYSLSPAFNGVTISGYCPEQSARARLQWVCFVIGAYVKACFNSEIEIEPIGSGVVPVPFEKTFAEPMPNVKEDDWVTAVRVTGYTFTAGTPGSGDESVTVGGTTYVIGKQTYKVVNSNAPVTAADRVIDVDGLYLINADNAADILARVAGYRFSRTSVQLDAVDNAEYIPGDRVSVYVTARRMFVGYLETCAFSFGVQARAKLSVGAAEPIPTALLTVLYKWNGRQLDRKEYVLPVGMVYEIENPYFDQTYNKHRYVLRPTTESVTGTMASGGATVTVDYEAALDLYRGTLHVISVDEIEVETDGAYTVGVIA